jgi:ABC-type transporter Mla subunit MlaD
MRIKKFNENLEIGPERIGEMVEELKELLTSLEEDSKTIERYLNELENYKSSSSKGNDQIDDSLAAFQIVKKNIEDSIDKTDTVVTNLNDYKENDRQYLYTENK